MSEESRLGFRLGFLVGLALCGSFAVILLLIFLI